MPIRSFFRQVLLRSFPTPLRWAASSGLVLLAFAVRYAVLGERPTAPYLTFFPAIVISAVLFGRGSGIWATIISAVLGVYFFVEPVHSFAILDTDTAVGLGLFVVSGFAIAAITEALHLAYVEVEAGQGELGKARGEADAARQHAEEAVRERDLLLVEYGHRVKNDLAQIAATIGMQAAGASVETVMALQSVAKRVKVLAHVHDRLSRRDGHVLVDMHDFLHDLVADLRASTTDLGRVGLFIEAEHHTLSVARAGAVGLIANELVTNALKHAFPDDRDGEVRVEFWRDGMDMILTVTDDGAGLCDALAEAVPTDGVRRGGLGQRLVRALAAQLGGHVEMKRNSGAAGITQILRFPVKPVGQSSTA
jgi:two-component sensor histidine kinase